MTAEDKSKPSDLMILDEVNYAIRSEMEDIAKINDCNIYELFSDEFIAQIESCKTWSSRLSDINGGDDFESMIYEALSLVGKGDKTKQYIRVCKKHKEEMTKIVDNILTDLKNHTWK